MRVCGCMSIWHLSSLIIPECESSYYVLLKRRTLLWMLCSWYLTLCSWVSVPDYVINGLAQLNNDFENWKWTNLNGMKSEYWGMKTRARGMKTRVWEMKTRVWGMKTKIRGMKIRVRGMKTKIRGMKSRIWVLQFLKTPILMHEMEGIKSQKKRSSEKTSVFHNSYAISLWIDDL